MAKEQTDCTVSCLRGLELVSAVSLLIVKVLVDGWQEALPVNRIELALFACPQFPNNVPIVFN